MLWTAPPPASRCAIFAVLFRSRMGGAIHGRDCHDWTRHC
jgi:hypothetical protein